jgi:membrane protein
MNKISRTALFQCALSRYHQTRLFIQFVFNNFVGDDCTYFASALTFTSLLAIVPLMSVSFSLLSSFPVFQDMSGPIQDFIFENFVPATGKLVQQYLIGFTKQVSNLSIWGVAFLFVTSVLLMFTIEQALNKIWKVRVQRRGTAAFLLYWAILSLAPILMGLSIAASSYVISLPFISKEAHINTSSLLRHAPFLLSFVSFTFLYMVVPNCKVRFLHAMTGSLFAAFLFEIAKIAFSWYLNRYHTYELLYGAFAIVPIFFLWVYWVWFIVLLGGEISYALSTHHHRRQGEPKDPFTHAMHWLLYFWEAQIKGEGLTINALIAKDDYAYQVKPESIIEHFLKIQLIQPLNDGRFILSRDLSSMSFYELTHLLPWPLPDWRTLTHCKSDKKLAKLLDDAQEKTQSLYKVNVSELFQ